MISNQTKLALAVAILNACPESIASAQAANEILAEIESLREALNTLTAAYAALAAQLDTDSGVADSTYGTGAETPPSQVY